MLATTKSLRSSCWARLSAWSNSTFLKASTLLLVILDHLVTLTYLLNVVTVNSLNATIISLMRLTLNSTSFSNSLVSSQEPLWLRLRPMTMMIYLEMILLARPLSTLMIASSTETGKPLKKSLSSTAKSITRVHLCLKVLSPAGLKLSQATSKAKSKRCGISLQSLSKTTKFVSPSWTPKTCHVRILRVSLTSLSGLMSTMMIKKTLTLISDVQMEQPPSIIVSYLMLSLRDKILFYLSSKPGTLIYSSRMTTYVSGQSTLIKCLRTSAWLSNRSSLTRATTMHSLRKKLSHLELRNLSSVTTTPSFLLPTRMVKQSLSESTCVSSLWKPPRQSLLPLLVRTLTWSLTSHLLSAVSNSRSTHSRCL